MSVTVVIDFDGTITMRDVSDLILAKYARGDWKSVEQNLVAGLISMNECINLQFSMIQGEPEEIRETALKIPIRTGFAEFVSFCETNNIEVICLSAGLSFIIEEFFKYYNIDPTFIKPIFDFLLLKFYLAMI